MAICSFALWRPLPENETEPFIEVSQFVFHTQVGYFGGLYSWFARGDVTSESHFGLSMGGLLEQYIDTDRQADAQRYANLRAISLECEDKGDPNNPYTDAQIEKMVRLARWAMKHHPNLRPQICADPYAPGFGWHSMWGAPSEWTPVKGKTCPGAVRIHQLKTVVLPEIFKEIPVIKIPVAIVVRDENGLDAGVGHVLRSRISTLIGFDVPVMSYLAAKGQVGHAVIIGSTKDMEFNQFDSHTIFRGEDRKETGQIVDALLGG